MVKKILISQPKPASDKSPYYDIAEDFDVELVFRPFIKVEGISTREFRDQRVNIADYTAIVFTSRHAIDNFFKLAKETRVTIPEDLKYFCVTETIALYIQKYVQYRKRKVFFGTTGKIDDLLPAMVKHKNEIVPNIFRRGAVIASSFGLYILCFADQNTVNFYRFGNYFYQIIIIL